MAIAMHFQGRLGNIMFQTAFLEFTAKRFGYETYYPNIKEHIEMLKGDKVYTPTPYADDYFKIFKNFNWHADKDLYYPLNHLVKEPPRFEWMHNVADNTKFQGYFQSEKYWGGDREFTFKLFEPSDFVMAQVLKYDHWFDQVVCSIHVRRGDYLKFPNVYPTADLAYVNRARALLRGHKIGRFLVFSDDIPWCKEIFKGEEYVFVEGEKDYVEMFLMARCNCRIVANSSFSWWGSYLSHRGGETVAPLKWFNAPHLDSKDICPWYWKLI